MRPLVFVVMLVAVKAFGYVDIPKPKVQARSADRVLEACEGQSSRGCTKFSNAALLCECIEEKDGWRLHASARAVPEVHVVAMSWVSHEMSHIWDFKRMLHAHTTALGERRFKTVLECEALSRAAGDAFPETMQRIARLSADRRDGKRLSTSEDHLVVVKAEVMPKLVDDRLADLRNDVPAAARNAEYRTAKDRTLVGERGKHVVASLRQGDAPIDSQQFVVIRSITENVAVFVSRLFFNHHDDVVEQPRKLLGQLFESLFDELLELRSA
jgi:hypothetical protein